MLFKTVAYMHIVHAHKYAIIVILLQLTTTVYLALDISIHVGLHK